MSLIDMILTAEHEWPVIVQLKGLTRTLCPASQQTFATLLASITHLIKRIQVTPNHFQVPIRM